MANEYVPIAKSPHTERLGAWFREARARAGFSQAALAATIGVAPNSVRWHEAGAVMLRVDVALYAASVIGLRELAPPEGWQPPEKPSLPRYERTRRVA